MFWLIFCPILNLAQCIDAGGDGCLVFYQILHLFILSSLCLLAHKASKKCFQFSRLATTALTLSHNCHPATFLSFLTVSLECYQVSWIKMKKHSLLQLYLHVLIDSISRICRVTFRDFVAYSKKK